MTGVLLAALALFLRPVAESPPAPDPRVRGGEEEESQARSRKTTFSGGWVNLIVVTRTSMIVSKCVKCVELIRVIGSAFLRMNSLNRTD